jgi:hypothetical protein
MSRTDETQPYRNSDMAHTTQTVFQVAHEVLGERHNEFVGDLVFPAESSPGHFTASPWASPSSPPGAPSDARLRTCPRG